MVISKYSLLGIVNIFSASFFTLVLITSPVWQTPPVSLASFIHSYAPLSVLLIALLLNGILIYRLLIKKEREIPLRLCNILTLSPIFWFLVLFIGYFFASNVFFPFIVIGLTLVVYFYSKKLSKKVAVLLSLMAIFVAMIAFISGFEEDYCWGKGIAADPTGSKMVKATKEDAEALKEFGATEGTPLSISFRTHMLCHQTFHLTNALLKNYFPQK